MDNENRAQEHTPKSDFRGVLMVSWITKKKIENFPLKMETSTGISTALGQNCQWVPVCFLSLPLLAK